jgi:hypothetical protein
MRRLSNKNKKVAAASEADYNPAQGRFSMRESAALSPTR